MAKTFRGLRLFIAAALVIAMLWSAAMMAQNSRAYQQEQTLHQALLALRPPEEDGSTAAAMPALRQLQTRNPDIVGWVCIPGTPIDYPFVQTANNSDYLRRDLDRNKALAGTIFMDSRCAADIPGENTILYGHNLQNEAMFGTLPSFAEVGFFTQHSNGSLFLGGQWYAFTIFACLEVAPEDAVVYAAMPAPEKAPEAYLEHIRPLASQYQDPGSLAGKRLVTLSTCSGATNRRRVVLVGYF